MFYLGKNILQSHLETLQPVTSYELFQKIATCDEEVKGLIEKLRRVRSIDRKAYDTVKKRLPFFTCSEFSNGLRKTENFIAAHGLVLDLDHCLHPDTDNEALRNQLKADARVMLLFTSPGGDGLKLVFRFQEPCPSPKAYSDFYKWFASAFAREYKIEQAVDFATHDVSRVCFLSHDPDAYHNPECEPLEWQVVNQLFDECPWEDAPGVEKKDAVDGKNDDGNEKKDAIDPAVYAEILKKLNPRARPKKTKIIYVPEQLQNIAEPVRTEAGLYGIELKEVRDIHYGKKLIFQHGLNFAEINVYYGKNGFTVTITPKSGSNQELGEVMKRLTEEVIWKLTQIPYVQKTLTQNVTKN